MDFFRGIDNVAALQLQPRDAFFIASYCRVITPGFQGASSRSSRNRHRRWPLCPSRRE
jgi:hypothetical protein